MTALTISLESRPTVGYTAVVEAGAEDIRKLEGLLRQGVQPGLEDPEGDDHLNQLIPKPGRR